MVVVGCAGGGGPAAGGGGGGGGGGGRDESFVNLNGSNGTTPPGLLDVYLLPGQGRAPGSKTASVHTIRFFNGLGQESDPNDTPVDILLKLDAFNVQSRAINAEISEVTQASDLSRTFTGLDLSFTDIIRNDDFDNPISYGGEIHKLLDSFLVTAYRGRVTAVQLKMHDAMFDDVLVGGQVAQVNFNTATFINENTNPETGKVTGFLSDYLAFDISGVANKPILASPSVAGQPANIVYMSGDSYALSVKDPRGVNGSAGVFEVLTKFGTFEGFFRPVNPTTGLRTYELKQADPSQVPALRLITALKGIYRPVDQVINNMKAFEFILLPKTGDGVKQEIAVLQRNTTTSAITNMWFGQADYSTMSFRVYPVRNVQPASTAGELRGRLVATYDASGAPVNRSLPNWHQHVRSGTYGFSGTPLGIPTDKRSGRFIVFR